MMMLSLNKNTRYACQIALPDFDEAVQMRLKNARILLVGAGGLGCPAAQYLAASGIGTLGIADFDTVSLSNLHRQILYTPTEIGQLKAVLAAQKLQAQNPDIQIVAITERINANNVFAILKNYDLVVDGTDNFETRYLLNDACVVTKKPLVYGAIYQYEGQVAVWNVARDDGFFSPNYRDIFPEIDATQVPNCAEGGVIPTIAGIIGCMQANEAIKYFTKTGDLLVNKILIFDAQTMQSRIIKTSSISTVEIKNIVQNIDIQTITLDLFFKNKEKYQLIDVREKAEHNLFNIGGEHIPLKNITEKIADFSFEKPILFYCATGKRSAEAAKIVLKNKPEVSAFSLEGGLK